MSDDFTEEQKQYLQGFAAGSGVGISLAQLPTWSQTLGVPVDPKARHAAIEESDPNRAAQARHLAEGKKLTPEEAAKRDIGHGLDVWDRMVEHARDSKYPKGTDAFLFKFQGMFYVAPAQDSFMCRLRIPGGAISATQLRTVADLAERHGGGYADLTTRANLQIREISAAHTVDVLLGLADVGIIVRGSGADNIRNVTCTPTAGFDPQELIDTLPLARQMHHHILNHREMYGLPRKFNIAFDGGGRVASLEDTNDIGFTATRVRNDAGRSEVLFRLTLGGITGHKDFARDTGIAVAPEDCIKVAEAVVKAFLEHGDRTDRKKARLKYVLDRLGFVVFLKEVECHLPNAAMLRSIPLEHTDARAPADRLAHVGVHPQKQPGRSYIGVVAPVGRMTCDQMRGLARVAERYGSGALRLTVWQNVLIPDIATADVAEVQREIERLGLAWDVTNFRAGLIACTGAAGCKFANAHTKQDAMVAADYLERHVGTIDVPINIHFTGCHNSCAQHYIGDIGLIGTKVPVVNADGEDDMLEGYHVFVGGGFGPERAIGREMFRNVIAADVPARLEQMVRGYLAHRINGDDFRAFVMRHPTEELADLFDAHAATV